VQRAARQRGQERRRRVAVHDARPAHADAPAEALNLIAA
jgi:hypothetical protein